MLSIRLYNNVSGVLLETRAIDGDFITLLPTGVYRIEIENTDTNCVFVEFYTVKEVPSFELIINNIQRACFNGTGSIDLSFNPSTPYAGDYTYQVFDITAGALTTLTGNGIRNGTTTNK